MSAVIEVDYLVVGAGAAAMAITDVLLTRTDATVAIVDRRHAPGGHWNDAYPFIRLHQPSAFYGVDSVPLGRDSVDACGLNAGFYESAGADELRAYFEHVMHRVFLPSGRVRYFPCSHYAGGGQGRHRFVCGLSGEAREVRVRRKLVDTTYVEGQVPATSPPPFEVAQGVRCVTPGGLVAIADGPARFDVVGAGKTAADTLVWLLERGVPASAIRWIKPRECWWFNRRHQQPLGLLPDLYEGVAMQVEAFAGAGSVDDAMLRLEADGFLLRVDRSVAPTMTHGAVLGEPELALLRGIGDVVRLGRVRRIERDRMVLDGGEVPVPPGTVHVHCAASGLSRPPLRPVFEPDRITVQPLFWNYACFQFALIGVAEAMAGDDAQKNRLCPPIHYWDRNVDYLAAYLALLASEQVRAEHPAVAAWGRTSRLNPIGRLADYRAHPAVVAAGARIARSVGPAVANLARLVAAER